MRRTAALLAACAAFLAATGLRADDAALAARVADLEAYIRNTAPAATTVPTGTTNVPFGNGHRAWS